jgi:hypothetical protein
LVAPAVFDSVTHIAATPVGRPVVCGSHGGLYSAQVAVACGVPAIIFSDAGIGKDQAGIAGLELLEAAGIAAAAADAGSARIGDGADIYRRGVVSHTNGHARRFGIRPGMNVSEAVDLMPCQMLARPAPRTAASEERVELDDWLPTRVVLIDSNSLACPADDDAVVVTGSHGGLLGGDPHSAIKCLPAAAFYNDAGIGMDRAGVGRLAALDDLNVVAAAVSHESARIGVARSTLQDGVLSTVNRAGAAAGLRVGMSTFEAIDCLVRRQPRPARHLSNK